MESGNSVSEEPAWRYQVSISLNTNIMSRRDYDRANISVATKNEVKNAMLDHFKDQVEKAEEELFNHFIGKGYAKGDITISKDFYYPYLDERVCLQITATVADGVNLSKRLDCISGYSPQASFSKTLNDAIIKVSAEFDSNLKKEILEAEKEFLSKEITFSSYGDPNFAGCKVRISSGQLIIETINGT